MVPDLILSLKSIDSSFIITTHHELQVVYDDVGNIKNVDSVSHGVQNFVNLPSIIIFISDSIPFWKFSRPYYLIGPMESQIIHGQFAKLLCPTVKGIQVVLKIDAGKLFQLSFCKTDIFHLEMKGSIKE